MFIREVVIHKFRNLENLRIGPLQEPGPQSDIIVLAGPNGCGKSSILELLNYAQSSWWGLGWGVHRTFRDFTFEVALALTSHEIELVRTHTQQSQTQMPGKREYDQEALEYLLANRYYYRRFGKSAQGQDDLFPLYDRCHNIVLDILRRHYKRPSGFFLRADRAYPVAAYQWQSSLFNKRDEDTLYRFAYDTSDLQYRDMYEFFIREQYHYRLRLGKYHSGHAKGTLKPGTVPPTDPLKQYDDLLQQVFPGYSFADNDEEGAAPETLFIRQADRTMPFHDLSSGEKEVFFVLSAFLRNCVSDAMISIDEPEMHLHPELARRLIRNMLSIRTGNQLWIATHNTEIIDEAGRDKTYYISQANGHSVLVPGSDEPAAIVELKNLFGVSGYIGVAKNMVFLEGEHSSADRKAFAWLFPHQGNSVKLIPSGSVDNQFRINAAILSILDATLGVCDFFLIRDRDYLTDDMAEAQMQHASRRLYVLKRAHIENYLISGALMSSALKDVFNITVSASEVEAYCKRICRDIYAEVLRDMLVFRLQLLYRPEDFGIGRMMEGQRIVDDNGDWIDEKMNALHTRLSNAASTITTELGNRATGNAIRELMEGCRSELNEALGDNKWINVFPGKRLLSELCRRVGVRDVVAFQNTLIKEMAGKRHFIPEELSMVIATIAQGGRF